MPLRIAAIRCGVLLLLAGAWPNFYPSRAQAQAPAVPAERGFIRSRNFQMPFNLPPGDVTKVQSVKLYVRSAASREWQLHATATTAQTRYDPVSRQQVGSFDVRLDQDGVYEFAIMTVFTDGASDPPGIDALRPEQSVIVDTVPPEIVLKPMPTRKTADGSLVVGYEWRVTDDHLARNSVRVEGRWYDVPTWHPIDTETEGRREWTIPAQRPMEVRVSAADKAGNVTSRSRLLGQQGSGSMTGQTGRAGGDGPHLPQTNFRLVNSQTIQLKYRIHDRPPSGLDRLELWVTRLGNKWERVEQEFKVPDDTSETAEIPYQTTQDGTYGFTIIAYSKAGIASRAAPKNNDPPQLWVEVDTKPPTATLKTVRLARPDDSRTLQLEWTAEDKNIEALPIIFEYAELDSAGNASPNWKELTPPLSNNGRYVCATPQLPPSSYQFRVRMHVFDRAGNVATIEHPSPVSVDVMKPQVEIFDVNSTKTPSASSPPERGPSLPSSGNSAGPPSLSPPGTGDLQLSQPPGLPRH